ncbi:Adenylate and Guanylate cyclase catalytic domain containing protein [Tritrichomonas foetus]|uniref:Adenylate and Guanylate cyclase catalytic domain containing protein n=1 Tax=Tritrichomonas foetus TaxID=1144522 RepID=A0A1J4JXH1_9EUKA|nr:Adenylate and Guanylate cyclase catalytic domain containing protein [Tritrichomonas foetus]|eukprot:OHT03849.1 Adenylate and Guanylate cyclase catalytic domain containing protein [Tritrichomonas foetus]
MNAPDPSLISKSQSASSTGGGVVGELLRKSQESVFFQLIDQLSTYVLVPSFIHAFFAVVVAIQILYASLWPSFSPLFNSSQTDFFGYFRAVACFSQVTNFNAFVYGVNNTDVNDTNLTVESSIYFMNNKNFQNSNYHNQSGMNPYKTQNEVNAKEFTANSLHNYKNENNYYNHSNNAVHSNFDSRNTFLEDPSEEEEGSQSIIVSEGIYCLYPFIAYSIVFVIVLATFVLQIACFNKIRRFYSKTLFPTRILLSLVPSVMILPLANFVGEMFMFIIKKNTQSPIYIVFFVLGIIELVFFCIIFAYTNLFFGISPYLDAHSPFVSMNNDFYVRLIGITPAFILVNNILYRYSPWILHPVIILHLAFNIFMFITITYRPFIRRNGNIFFMGIILACILNNIMRLILIFVAISNTIGLILFFVFLFGGFATSVIFYIVQEKKICKNLANFTDTLTDDEKKQLFKDLGIEKSLNKMIMYLDYVWGNQFIPLLNCSTFIYSILSCNNICATIHVMKTMIFLPSNGNKINLIMNETLKKRNLSCVYRFFLFQVQKVKMTRQSSTSTLAIEKLKTLKQTTKDLETRIKGFFTRNDANIMLLLNYSNDTKKAKSLWDEVLRSYPNSIPHIDESVHFQVECTTDFIEAIRLSHRGNMIESGRNYNVDTCYRHFVMTFPQFLKKNIIDMKGNFIKISRGKKSGSVSSTSINNSSSQGISMTSSSSAQLDLQVEECIGKNLLKNARVRLALQRATQNRKADIFTSVIWIVLILFALGIGCFFFLYFYFDSYFDTRGENTDRMELSNGVRINLYGTSFSNLYYWGNFTNAIDESSFSRAFERTDDPDVYFFPPDSQMDWEWKAVYFSINARLKLRNLLLEVSEMALDKIDVYKYAQCLFEEIIPISYCNHGAPVNYSIKANLKTIVPFLLMEMTMFSTFDPNIWWLSSPDVCNVWSSMGLMWEGFEHIRQTLTSYGNAEMVKTKNILTYMQIAFPLGYGVITVVLFTIFTLLYIKEINKFTELIIKLPTVVKQEACRPLRKDHEDDSSSEEQNESLSSFSLPVVLVVIIDLLFIINALLMMFQIDGVTTTNQNYNYLLVWTADSRVRKCLVLELVYWLFNMILLENPLVKDTKIINSTHMEYLATLDFEKLDSATTSLMTSTKGNPSSIGIDDEIDQLTLLETCEANANSSDLHDQYRCSSAQHQINTLLGYATQMMLNISIYHGNINETIPIHAYHLATSHLIPKLIQIDDRYNYLSEYYKETFESNQLTFLICEIVVTVFIFSLISYLIMILNNCYSVVLTILRRISPASIVSTDELIGYLLNESKRNKEVEMTEDQGVIHHSKDTIVCLNPTGVIEITNPALTKTFGFTPEQLLGQSIETIFSLDNKVAIMNQLELMKHKQSSMIYECHMTCLADDDSEIQCAITIMGMENSAGDVTGFVVILKDESELVKKQGVAEEAKKRSETLLYQILPRDIVIRLNQGEKDISFSVPSATIMFIDIVKFSEYAASLSPSEIMSNLSLVFAGFDENIGKYPLLIKIKLIGDVYMCAGGLFTPDEPPQAHADQMIKMALDSLQTIDDVNVKLNTLLNVRIGINTGGPLIAGVLGTDKPTFDIIGDPINIASRLQSTDYPGKIQISQATFDLVKGSDYSIEPRGEVYLKGKGKQPAYFISPVKTISYVMSSSDIL